MWIIKREFLELSKWLSWMADQPWYSPVPIHLGKPSVSPATWSLMSCGGSIFRPLLWNGPKICPGWDIFPQKIILDVQTAFNIFHFRQNSQRLNNANGSKFDCSQLGWLLKGIMLLLKLKGKTFKKLVTYRLIPVNESPTRRTVENRKLNNPLKPFKSLNVESLRYWILPSHQF